MLQASQRTDRAHNNSASSAQNGCLGNRSRAPSTQLSGTTRDVSCEAQRTHPPTPLRKARFPSQRKRYFEVKTGLHFAKNEKYEERWKSDLIHSDIVLVFRKQIEKINYK